MSQVNLNRLQAKMEQVSAKLNPKLTDEEYFLYYWGHWNYQVRNGGVGQYFDNGYAQRELDKLWDLLRRSSTVVGRPLPPLLVKLLDIIRPLMREFTALCRYYDGPVDETDDHFADLLETATREYYKLSEDQLVDEVAAYCGIAADDWISRALADPAEGLPALPRASKRKTSKRRKKAKR